MQEGTIPDHEFVASLIAAIERYLYAADQWEAAYRKLSRLPGYPVRFGEVEAEQREYGLRRCELETMLPRARRLCARHCMDDPFTPLLRMSPRQPSPVIGREERGAVSRALVELHAACSKTDWSIFYRGSLVQRLVSYFS